jgi:hypothetical protein
MIALVNLYIHMYPEETTDENKILDLTNREDDEEGPGYIELKPGEDSSFKIDLFSDTKDTVDTVDHYILFVVATPKA